MLGDDEQLSVLVSIELANQLVTMPVIFEMARTNPSPRSPGVLSAVNPEQDAICSDERRARQLQNIAMLFLSNRQGVTNRDTLHRRKW